MTDQKFFQSLYVVKSDQGYAAKKYPSSNSVVFVEEKRKEAVRIAKEVAESVVTVSKVSFTLF